MPPSHARRLGLRRVIGVEATTASRDLALVADRREFIIGPQPATVWIIFLWIFCVFRLVEVYQSGVAQQVGPLN